MSETPRTDAALANYDAGKGPAQLYTTSRQLESENTEALALLCELNDALVPIPAALQARVDAVLDRVEEKT